MADFQRIQLQDLYEDLKDVAVLWSQLGLQLDLSKDSLDKIDSNVNSRDGKVEYCFTKVLQTWLTGDPAKVNKKTLVEAVRKTGNVRLANELESQDLVLDLKTLCTKLEMCKHNYSKLGISLDVSYDKIKEFQKYKGDCSQCLIDVLDVYLQEKNPNLEEICQALEKIGRRDKSRFMKNKYQTNYY